jgi:uncharacterized protein (UPF0335 family)
MSKTMEGAANASDVGGIAGERLRSFIERIDKDDYDEQETLLDIYMRALGMLFAALDGEEPEPPAGR